MPVRTRSSHTKISSPASDSTMSSRPSSPSSVSEATPLINDKSKNIKTNGTNGKACSNGHALGLRLGHDLIPEGHPMRRKTFHGRPRLLTYAEAVKQTPWAADNELITRGYRPQLYNMRACLWSAIGYVHNETVNIHTHSIGALFFAILLPLHLFSSHFPTLGVFPGADSLPPTTTFDKAALTCYCLSAIACLSFSSWFHTVQPCSKGVCEVAHRGDYIGIVVLIVGSILPGMHYGFHDNPILQGIYMTAIATAGLAAGYVVLSPHHRNHRWDRTLTFIGLGLSAVVPVGHVVLKKGLPYAREMMGFDYILAGGVSYIFGALLYAARFPERIFPGVFDFIGSSHQIFHVFVLVGAWCQFSALRWMVVGRANA